MATMKFFSVIVLSLICAATTAPLDSEHQIPTAAAPAAAKLKIPPYIKKIYQKMNQAMEQDDLDVSLKYLKTVRTVHWLEPVTHSE